MTQIFFTENKTLWETDGTPAGSHQVSSTQIVVPQGPHLMLFTNYAGPQFFDAQGHLFFTEGASSFAGNNTVWTSDGTANGTQQIGGPFGDPSHPMLNGIGQVSSLNGTLFFAADDNGTHGYELWQSDGTSGGTHLVKDINSHYTDSSNPSELTPFNGALYFSANDGTHGTELWRTDGTAAGTQAVVALAPQHLTVFENALFFGAGAGLWKSDGTQAGTQQLAGGLSNISQIATGSSKLFFTDGDLWVSDGSTAGTQEIAPIADFAGQAPTQLTTVGDGLFFVAKDGAHGAQLWESDGTSAGTKELTLANTATTSPGLNPAHLTPVGTKLFFAGTDGSNGSQLWVSDGTSAGTQELTTIGGSNGLAPRLLTNVNGTLFFASDNGPDGGQVWVSDGTAAGTHEVTHFPATANGYAAIRDFTVIGNKLYFSANDGTGVQAFATDGTTTQEIASVAGSPYAGSFIALPDAAPTPPHIVVPPGNGAFSFDTTQTVFLDLSQADQPHSFSVSGNDTIVGGAAAASITATAGNDLVSLPTAATGGMTFIGQVGNDTVNAAAGNNSLAGSTGADVFNVTGGTSWITTGSGTASINISGGDNTVQASQGSSTITNSGAPLLLGVLGGSHQVNLTDGTPIILDVGGTSTVSASGMPAAPEIGVFGGTHQINAGAGGDTVFGVGGTATVNGGAGINGVDLVTGSLQVNAGPGITELFVNGGDNTLLLQSNGGPTLISGFDPAHLQLVIASHINGNVFADPSQIPTSHTADGSLLMDLGAGANGEEQILLVGVSSIPASAITLV